MRDAFKSRSFCTCLSVSPPHFCLEQGCEPGPPHFHPDNGPRRETKLRLSPSPAGLLLPDFRGRCQGLARGQSWQARRAVGGEAAATSPSPGSLVRMLRIWCPRGPEVSQGAFQALYHILRSSGITGHSLDVTLGWGQVYAFQFCPFRFSAETYEAS